MKQHHLFIQANARPEVLERILRVVRHRGFRVCAMSVVEALHTPNIVIEITVKSERSITLLVSQLNKLLDVLGVELQTPVSQPLRA